MSHYRTATAYHEAGHAVIGFIQGLSVGNVSISASPDRLGYTEILPQSDAERIASENERKSPGSSHSYYQLCPTRFIRKHLLRILAGPVAQSYYERQSEIVLYGSDYQQAAMLASILVRRLKDRGKSNSYEKRLELLISEFTIECCQLVKMHFPIIQKLAKRLLLIETVFAEDVRDIVSPRSLNAYRCDS